MNVLPQHAQISSIGISRFYGQKNHITQRINSLRLKPDEPDKPNGIPKGISLEPDEPYAGFYSALILRLLSRYFHG